MYDDKMFMFLCADVDFFFDSETSLHVSTTILLLFFIPLVLLRNFSSLVVYSFNYPLICYFKRKCEISFAHKLLENSTTK